MPTIFSLAFSPPGHLATRLPSSYRQGGLDSSPTAHIEQTPFHRATDGIIIVTPEYNGGLPASLKNAIDVLYDEWHSKPISIVTVSGGVFGGTQALVSLQFVLWKIGAWTVTNMFHVAKVHEAYDESGHATDKTTTDKLTKVFVEELLSAVEANKKH